MTRIASSLHIYTFSDALIVAVKVWLSPSQISTARQNGTTTQEASPFNVDGPSDQLADQTARQRSRPGEGADEVKYDKTVDSCVLA